MFWILRISGYAGRHTTYTNKWRTFMQIHRYKRTFIGVHILGGTMYIVQTNIRAFKALKYLFVFAERKNAKKMANHPIYRKALENKNENVAPVCRRSQYFSKSPPVYLFSNTYYGKYYTNIPQRLRILVVHTSLLN